MLSLLLLHPTLPALVPVARVEDPTLVMMVDPPLDQPTHDELGSVVQFIFYERNMFSGDLRVLHCTSFSCYLSASPETAHTLCESMRYGETQDALRQWYNMSGLSVWFHGCDVKQPRPSPMAVENDHRNAGDTTPLCARKCLRRVRDVYGRWESLDTRCKAHMNAADGRWDDKTMMLQKGAAKRLCRDNLCTIEDDLLDLEDDMERDVLAYCGIYEDLPYFEAPSPAPPLVNEISLVVHVVLNTTSVTEQDMELTIHTALDPHIHVTCTSWIQGDETVAHECTLFAPKEDATWACGILEFTLGDVVVLAQSLGTHVVSANIVCTLVSRYVRPPPSSPYQRIEMSKSMARRSAANRRSVPRPFTTHDATAWHAAALVALLLSATSLGCQLRASRALARRVSPFVLRVGKRKRVDRLGSTCHSEVF